MKNRSLNWKNSIVAVMVGSKTLEFAGMGFFVDDQGHILTCEHVIPKESDEKTISVLLGDRKSIINVSIVKDYVDEYHDVVILRIDRNGLTESQKKYCRPLPVALRRSPDEYPVESLTYDYDKRKKEFFTIKTSKAKIVSYDEIGRIQIESNTLTRGFSGSPIWDKRRECVIGMASSIIGPKSGRLTKVFFAISSNALHPLYQSLFPFNDLDPPINLYLEGLMRSISNLPYGNLSITDYIGQDNRNLFDNYVIPKFHLIEQSDDITSFSSRKNQLYIGGGIDSIFRNQIDAEKTALFSIIGLAGSGKSSLLRYCAVVAMNDEKYEEIGLPKQCLPLLLKIKSFNSIKKSSKSDLFDLLEEAATNDSIINALRSLATKGILLQDWPTLTGRRWLILLDGLDELSKLERRRFTEWICKSISKHTDKIAAIVITQRPVRGIHPEFIENAKFIEIMPFSDNQTKLFAKNWFHVNSNNYLNKLSEIERIRQIPRTPWFLTMLAIIYQYSHKELPNTRFSLFNTFINVIMERSFEEGVLKEFKSKSKNFKKSILATLQLLAFIDLSNPFLKNATNYLNLAKSHLIDLEKKKKSPYPDDLNILDFLLNESLIENNGFVALLDNSLSWTHQTIRDFFAVGYLFECARIDTRHPDFESALEKWDNEIWTDPLSLLIYKVDVDESILWRADDYFKNYNIYYDLRVENDPVNASKASLIVGCVIIEGATISNIIRNKLINVFALKLKRDYDDRYKPISCASLVRTPGAGHIRNIDILIGLCREYDYGEKYLSKLLASSKIDNESYIEITEYKLKNGQANDIRNIIYSDEIDNSVLRKCEKLLKKYEMKKNQHIDYIDKEDKEDDRSFVHLSVNNYPNYKGIEVKWRKFLEHLCKYHPSGDPACSLEAFLCDKLWENWKPTKQ